MSTTDVVSINSLNVTEGSGYVATLVQSYGQPEASISRAQRDGDSPLVTNAAPGVLEAILTVIVDAREADADTVDARRRALLRALDTSAAPLTLVIRNEQGTARERYMRFVVVKTDQVAGQFGEGFAARLNSADDVRWRSTARVELTREFTDDGGGWVVECQGDLEAYPTYTLTRRADRTAPAWAYARRFIVRWRSPWGGEHSVDVTNGTLNTAALKTAGKVNNASNIGVVLNGRYVPFWYGAADGQVGGFNSTASRLFVTMKFVPATMAYLTRYAGEADTTLFVRNDANLPDSGVLDIEGEFITFAYRSAGTLYGVQRGQFGSTASDHVAGAEVEPAHTGFILYGPNGAVPESAKDYDYRNAKPPVFLDSVSTTNTVWDFGLFRDPERSFNWSYDWFNNSGTAFVSESQADGTYDPAWVTPWTALGFKPGWASLSLFSRLFAVPIQSVRVIGRRYRSGSQAQYTNSPRLQLTDPLTGASRVVWESANGIGATPNPTFDVALPAVPAGQLFSKINWLFNQSNFAQVDIQRMYVSFRDEYLPYIWVSAEVAEYDLDVTLDNMTTDDRLSIDLPQALVDSPLVIDSERMTATYQGASVYASVRRGPAGREVRAHFLKLVPGSNSLYLQEEGTGTMELKISYESRWYA